MTAAGAWVPVAERLPPLLPEEWAAFERESAPVLAFSRIHGDRAQVATYRVDIEDGGGRWVSECSEGWTLPDVTHWAPIDYPQEIEQ